MKARKAPYIELRHKKERLESAPSIIDWNNVDWCYAVFNDEKKFKTDGPDGLNYH